MNIDKSSLYQAVEQGILSKQQAEQLYSFLKSNPSQAQFNFTHVLYYLGGLIAIGAMTLFMNLGWEAFGGWGIVFICGLYAVVGLFLTNRFQSKGLAIPAGICATFVVALTPLWVYGLQQALGVWPDESVYREYHRLIKWHWLYMELATLVVGILVAYKYKYPFLFMPIAVTLWYLTMDVAAMISGGDYSWELRSLVSMYCGLLMIGLAFWVDIRARYQADYAFWIYLFGVLAFWGGLSSQSSDSELAKFIYFSINLTMIGIGVMLVRRAFVIFGAMGCCGYLGHLASSIFQDSWLFPIALTIIGLLVIYLGVLWQRHEATLAEKLRCRLPQALRELLESKQ